MAIQINVLSNALGAEVSGLDLTRPAQPADVAAIQSAFLEDHLLCLRGQPLEPGAFARVARYFGEPQPQLLRSQRVEDLPEVSVLDSTYKTPKDKPDDMAMARLSGWHTDDSYFEIPAKATLFQALAIPDAGGQTRFCNTRQAYEDLSPQMKARIDSLQAVHSYDTVRAPARALPRSEIEKRETPDVVHPLVRTHEDTGQKAIYFNSNRTDCIVGMERAESDKLLDWIHQHMTQPKYRYDHSWRIGDILLWDNRSLIHSVNMDFPVGQRRLHQRILLKGTRPV
ncbi:MAG: TauD/TfdA dioxygenase family protein [Burkholderiales bacterium]